VVGMHVANQRAPAPHLQRLLSAVSSYIATKERMVFDVMDTMVPAFVATLMSS